MAELTCPQPHKVPMVPNFMEGLGKLYPLPKSILPKHIGSTRLEVFSIILNKDDLKSEPEWGSPKGFFCGSPPLRSHNPLVRDAQFNQQTQFLASSLSSSGAPKHSTRASAPPSCGSFSGSPKVRIEGFACGKSGSPCIFPTFAS
ncbi:hypothetical protein AXF42_Ash011849 [Apostasia shenzhenica]|uniref:Uncharacterized protein n=1 Tax=Apostasia shenzhenica TaxID=1088818 RepID=A0A2I0AVZ9_9ASPA|nr:hypothetical protein AXF42_Ash011849 [Apostasia shenzhenica]